MPPDAGRKSCAILLSMGGPESTGDVKQYLRNIFSDRTLIRLPGGRLFQKPFAHLISNLRRKKGEGHDNPIGGGSPLLRWTEAQARMIEDILKGSEPGFRCFSGMRYFKPYIEEVIREAVNDGFQHITFMPLYPQYSTATTGSSFDVARKVLKNHPDITATFINDFHDDEAYTTLLNDYIEKNIAEGETPSEDYAERLVGHVREVIGPIATIDHIQLTRDVPKTRSGKIMRRILRKIAGGETDMEAFGDTSTLADPSVVEDLLAGKDRY